MTPDGTTLDPTCVDARREAVDRLDGRYDARVLEPSPPAVLDAPDFADDPVAPGEPRGRPVVSPVPNGDVTWDELARDDPVLGRWCADRWLGAWPRLEPIADREAFVRTRDAWHALAEHLVARARYDATGRIGLRFTRGCRGRRESGSAR